MCTSNNFIKCICIQLCKLHSVQWNYFYKTHYYRVNRTLYTSTFKFKWTSFESFIHLSFLFKEFKNKAQWVETNLLKLICFWRSKVFSKHVNKLVNQIKYSLYLPIEYCNEQNINLHVLYLFSCIFQKYWK